MSRIGKMPINISDKIKVSFDSGTVKVNGPLGELTQNVENNDIEINIGEKEIVLTRKNDKKETKSAHGLYRSLIANMVEGVEKGYSKNLILNGVGYRAAVQGDKLTLNVGYSHPVNIQAPSGITIECLTPTEVVVKGIDKTIVGQCAADIKAVRKPEPYHGYGIRYKDETILRKEGKAAGK